MSEIDVCPKCHSDNLIKRGIIRNRQRWLCLDCNYQVASLEYYERMQKVKTLPIEEIKKLYIDDKLSTTKIAKLYNVCEWTIRNRLKGNGIVLRTHLEARKYNSYSYRKYPIHINERTGHIMSRQEYENEQSGLTIRGTERKRKNYGQEGKVCRRCGCKLIVGENISAYSFRLSKANICRQCHVIDVQINYALHRRERIEHGKNRQGITPDCKCAIEGCDAIWYILQIHHMPDGTLSMLCPNHHALWHFDNGKVVRKGRFSKKIYKKWSEVLCLPNTLSVPSVANV